MKKFSKTSPNIKIINKKDYQEKKLLKNKNLMIKKQNFKKI